jgi:hypothetical protein
MTRSRSSFFFPSTAVSLIGALILSLCITTGANAQVGGTIDSGTTIMVRTNQDINASNSDGRAFSGVVDQDVMNRRGEVAIPRGSDVELVVRNVSNNEVALDLNAVTVNGQRYAIDTQNNVVTSERKEGIGANKRTGKYVGGGAVIGAIIGAIAGGGKGAAIGAGVGAGAGAGAQVLTRGKSVSVPAESLLTFRLQQPLQTGDAASSDSRYKPGYLGSEGTNSAAYRAGLAAGRSDADRNLSRNTRTNRYSSAQDRADYEAGYNRGYDGYTGNTSSVSSNGNGSISVGRDNNVTWQGPQGARVYVIADNEGERLFSGTPSGTESAPWIQSGHVYTFILKDQNGNEIARDRVDLRPRGRYRR